MAPKLSKKEKQALKEAELARIAEEQRLEEEKAEAERLAEEKRMAEELAARVKAETELYDEFNALLDAENAANEGLQRERVSTLSKEQAKRFDQDEWAVFVACEPLPDVQREGEVQTFLTEWGEKPQYGADHVDKTMADCSLCTVLLSSLQLEAAYAAGRHEAKQAAWQKEIQLGLKAEMQQKIDGATADFLQRAEEFAVPPANLCVICVPADGCRFGLWVNLAKNPRIKSIDYTELNIGCELPKALALASIAVRMVHYSTDLTSPYASEEVVASNEWMVLGGTLDVDLLTLPPGAKKVKGWTMRPVTELTTGVRRMAYPIPGADGSIPAPGTSPPLRISYQIPPTVLLPDKVETVGYWLDGKWDMESISLVEFDTETRTLSFNTETLTSLGLLQPTHLELPYKQWIFSPSGLSAGALHLKTQRFDISIDISSAGCTLRQPDRPELAALIGVPMAAAKLVLKLRACGINLQPRDADALKLKRITPKNTALEKDLHEALAPLVCRYHLAPSKWNQSRGDLKFAVRLSPSEPSFGDDDEVAPPPSDPYAPALGDWPCLEYSLKRAVLISALDADATCDETPLKGGTAHSTPLEAVKPEDAEIIDMLRTSSRLYQDTVRQLMDELRLFSFTAE